MLERVYGSLRVVIYDTNDEMGVAAALKLGSVLRDAAAQQGDVSMVLATGNSQLSFYEALCTDRRIPWDKITVFHMDEYVGISDEHPASFRRYMREKLVDIVNPLAFHGIAADSTDLEAEIRRYTELLSKGKPVACVMGIGENGHLAFNDPPADFWTTASLHVVRLAEAARRQQVGEGHFEKIEDVPKRALSLTVAELLKPANLVVVVPEARKARAVKMALEGPIAPDCPASILRSCANATLYLDRDSASLLA